MGVGLSLPFLESMVPAQTPLVKTAGLLSALPRKFAYGLQALIEKQAA